MVGHHLESILLKQAITPEEFANTIGVGKSSIYKIIRGDTKKFTLNMAERINESYPEYSVQFILSLNKKDTSPNEDYFKSKSTNEPEQSYQVDFTELSVMYVPLVSKFAYAGYLGGFGDEEYVGDLPKIPFANGFRPKGKYLCFEVRGDSMTNDTRESIEEGDIVLAREVKKEYWTSKLHIRQWDFVIVHNVEGILVKRISDHNVQKGELTLHSLNDYYEDFTVKLNDVAQILNIVEITKKPRR